MIFIHKLPLAPSKWLSRWIKVDKWDYFHFLSQDFVSISYFDLIFFNMKPLSEEVPCLLFIQIQIQTVCHVYFRGENVPVVKGLLSAGLKSNGFELNPMFEFWTTKGLRGGVTSSSSNSSSMIPLKRLKVNIKRTTKCKQ